VANDKMTHKSKIAADDSGYLIDRRDYNITTRRRGREEEIGEYYSSGYRH
jgi:hypothetical protein